VLICTGKLRREGNDVFLFGHVYRAGTNGMIMMGMKNGQRVTRGLTVCQLYVRRARARNLTLKVTGDKNV